MVHVLVSFLPNQGKNQNQELGGQESVVRIMSGKKP